MIKLLMLINDIHIQKYDSRKMYQAYEKWPEIAQKNYFSRPSWCENLKNWYEFGVKI